MICLNIRQAKIEDAEVQAQINKLEESKKLNAAENITLEPA